MNGLHAWWDLNPPKIIWLAYAFCGLCAGIAGLVASLRIYSADANNIGLNMELDAIAAVALGGNSLGGGKVLLLGSVIGAYTIQALTTTLYAMSVPSDQISGVQGNRGYPDCGCMRSEELRKLKNA